MQIELLADRPEFVSLLAAWHQAEWASLRPGFTLEDRVAKLRGACGRAQPPVVFVASEGERLLGSAMLLAQDMDTRPELTPWLGGVFTAPEVRGKGVARALIDAVAEAARAHGASKYYWQTRDTNLAARALYDKVARHKGFIRYDYPL